MITYSTKRSGRGVFNKVLNSLPIELHIPGYQYCGPGTKLVKRLARGDPGINPLDQACKEHDIAYSKNRNYLNARHAADTVLADKAMSRVLAKDSSLGEKSAAYIVSNAMKLKSKLGLGMACNKKRTLTQHGKKKRSKKPSTKLTSIIKAATKAMTPSMNFKVAAQSALKGARAAIKKAGGRSKIIIPRTIPMSSKIGGALPFLIPLFAGLSATGALAGGAASIAKAVNEARSARDQLSESKRHNKTMEAIALGKGLYLKPYKTGMGLCIKPYKAGGQLKKKKKL